jgi:hypothetical protein
MQQPDRNSGAAVGSSRVDQVEIVELQRHVKALEEEVTRLRAASNGAAPGSNGATTAREDRYRTLFDAIDEGFCVIEFLDGPHGPLSDYVHIEANAESDRRSAKWYRTRRRGGSSSIAACS